MFDFILPLPLNLGKEKDGFVGLSLSMVRDSHLFFFYGIGAKRIVSFFIGGFFLISIFLPSSPLRERERK